eukprot:467168_1
MPTTFSFLTIPSQNVQLPTQHSQHLESNTQQPTIEIIQENEGIDEYLPNGWSKHYTSEGKPYYQNNNTKITQWNAPTIQIIELPVIQTNVSDDTQSEQSMSQRSRRSTIGEKNLAERTCCETFLNLIGIILAIIAMGFDFEQLFTEKAEPMTVLKSIIEIIVAIISLIINLFDIQTGDCECLRDTFMYIICLWWCKKSDSNCCFEWYEKISNKLLMLFNAVLWCGLMINDAIKLGDGITDFFSFGMAKFAFINAVVGFGVSLISFFFYTSIGKCIGKAICIVVCFIPIFVIIATVIASKQSN